MCCNDDSGRDGLVLMAVMCLVQLRSKVLEHVFVAFDVDSSGHVDSSELQLLGSARQKLGQKTRDWTDDKNQGLIRSLDADSDGKVSMREFVRGFSTRVPEEMNDFLRLVKEFHEVRCIRLVCVYADVAEIGLWLCRWHGMCKAYV